MKGEAMTQNEILIDHMKNKGAITAAEAMRRYGIGRLAARIADIKEKGVPVITEMVTGKTRLGKKMRYARYMIGESDADND